MNENLNLIEILKDCPKGTKLYSTVLGEVEFDTVNINSICPINVIINDYNTCDFTADGRMYDKFGGECVLFPSKGQRDWSKFTAPWYKKDKLVKPKFKVGDWLCANELNDYANNIKIVNIVDVFGKKRYKISRDYDSDLDLVEFNFIEEHYHLWTIQDAKDGDVLYSLDSNQPFIYKERNDYEQATAYCGLNMYGKFFVWGTKDCAITLNNYVPATKEQCDALMKAMNGAGYEWDGEKKELKKLKKPKFDPNTLNPFDKVLARNDREDWSCVFFSHIVRDEETYPYACGYDWFTQCIPYNEETKHLVGTAEEAPEFYRYWED